MEVWIFQACVIAVMREQRYSKPNSGSSNPKVTSFQTAPDSLTVLAQLGPDLGKCRVVGNDKESLKEYCQPIALLGTPIILLRPRPQFSNALEA